MELKTATVVKVYRTHVWIDSTMWGERRVMMQHEGCEPFAYATFGYDYRYTSNAATFQSAHALAVRLGATEPVEHRRAPLPGLRRPDSGIRPSESHQEGREPKDKGQESGLSPWFYW